MEPVGRLRRGTTYRTLYEETRVSTYKENYMCVYVYISIRFYTLYYKERT